MKNYKKVHQFRKSLIFGSSAALAALGLIGASPNTVHASSKSASDLSSTRLAAKSKKTLKNRHFKITADSAGEKDAQKSQTVNSSSAKNVDNQSDSVENPQTRAYTGQPVTVYYKNEKGEEISPKKILNGNIGDSYTAPVYINNSLRVKQVNGNINGTFSGVSQEVTYIYTDEGEPVTIVNEDENGGPVYNERGQVIPVQYITGKIGTVWTAIPMYRKGYIYKEAKTEGAVYPGAVIGYYGSLYSKPGKITFIYSDKAAPVTVHYLREDNSKIIPDEQVTGRPDYEYDIKPKVLSGYTFKETIGNPKGAFSDKPKEVTFIYSVNPDVPVPPAKVSNVIVHYQDENGNSVATDEVLTGKVGDGYQTVEKTISGYTLKVRPDNATGFFTEAQQVVTYIYVANTGNKPVTPVNPVNPTNPTIGNDKEPNTNPKKPKPVHTDKKQPTANKVNKPIHKDPENKAAHLPQTGSDQQSGLAAFALGLLSLLGSLGGYFVTSKNRKNNN